MYTLQNRRVPCLIKSTRSTLHDHHRAPSAVGARRAIENSLSPSLKKSDSRPHTLTDPSPDHTDQVLQREQLQQTSRPAALSPTRCTPRGTPLAFRRAVLALSLVRPRDPRHEERLGGTGHAREGARAWDGRAQRGCPPREGPGLEPPRGHTRAAGPRCHVKSCHLKSSQVKSSQVILGLYSMLDRPPDPTTDHDLT